MIKSTARGLAAFIVAIASLSSLVLVIGAQGSAGAANAGTSASVPSSATSGGQQSPAWSFVPLSQSANFLSRTAIHLLAGPGQTVSDTAVLTNYSTQTLNFDVYGSDAVNTPQGAFTLQAPNVHPREVGTWIALPVNQYNLPPRTATEFHFEVKVPANATPGDHAGGIVALNLAPNTHPQGGTQFAVQRGEGIAVYVRVPGPLHPGVAASNIGATYSSPPIGFGGSWAKVHYQVVNTGNVVLNGTSQAAVTNLFGTTVHRFPPVHIDALIPGERMSVVEPKWQNLPFIGPVHLKVVITTTAVKSTGESQFWVVPWLLILIIVVALVLLWYLWRRRRRRNRVDKKESGQPVEPQAAVAPTSAPDRPAPVL